MLLAIMSLEPRVTVTVRIVWDWPQSDADAIAECHPPHPPAALSDGKDPNASIS